MSSERTKQRVLEIVAFIEKEILSELAQCCVIWSSKYFLLKANEKTRQWPAELTGGDAHLQMPQLARIQRILGLKFREFGDTFKSCEHNLDLCRFVHFTSLLIVWLHVD